MEHQEYLDAKKSLSSNNNQEIHSSLEQRRKKFMETMKDNKLFQIMLAQFPEINKFSIV